MPSTIWLWPLCVLTQLASSPIQSRLADRPYRSKPGDGDNRIDLGGNVTNSGTQAVRVTAALPESISMAAEPSRLRGNGTFGKSSSPIPVRSPLTGNIEITNRLTLTATSLPLNDRQVTFGTGAEVTGLQCNPGYLRSNGCCSATAGCGAYATGAPPSIFRRGFGVTPVPSM